MPGRGIPRHASDRDRGVQPAPPVPSIPGGAHRSVRGRGTPARRPARLETPEPLPRGTTSHFYFIVPDHEARISCVDVTATVAWSNGHAMGLHFEHHPTSIAQYLTRLASQLSMR